MQIIIVGESRNSAKASARHHIQEAAYFKQYINRLTNEASEIVSSNPPNAAQLPHHVASLYWPKIEVHCFFIIKRSKR